MQNDIMIIMFTEALIQDVPRQRCSSTPKEDCRLVSKKVSLQIILCDLILTSFRFAHKDRVKRALTCARTSSGAKFARHTHTANSMEAVTGTATRGIPTGDNQNNGSA